MKKITAALITVIMLLQIFTVFAVAAYENTHKNTGNMPEDLIAVAYTQLGYKSTRDSSGNYSKFGKWYGINPGEWCAMFVSWCANQAEIPVTVIPRHASCDMGMEWFKDKGRWYDARQYGGTYTPRRGDIIYFCNDNKKPWDATHVGIVTKTDGSYIYTIEGNSSDKVAERKYEFASTYVLGFGAPNYSTETNPPQDTSYKPGRYYVATDSLNVRSVPEKGGDSTVIGTRRLGDSIDVLEVKNVYWGKIKLADGSYGWISLRYCTADKTEVVTETYKIIFDPNGGQNEPDPIEDQKNVTVEIPDGSPVRDGYAFAGWATSGSSEKVEYLPKAKIEITGNLRLYAVWEEKYPLGFLLLTDIRKNSWYYEATSFCYRRNIMTGVSASSFRPDDPVTRGAFALIIGKIYVHLGGSIPEITQTPFDDVSVNSYYGKYVAWAKDHGIVSGSGGGKFDPNAPVTREQLAVMIWRAAEFMGLGGREWNIEMLNQFDDAIECSAWAAQSLAWAVANGILAGSGNNIMPRSNATRAQIAQIIYAMIGY